MAEFFAMGGYAGYIWPAYALAAAVMVGLLASTLIGLRSNEETLKALEAARGPRRPRRSKATESAPVLADDPHGNE